MAQLVLWYEVHLSSDLDPSMKQYHVKKAQKQTGVRANKVQNELNSTVWHFEDNHPTLVIAKRSTNLQWKKTAQKGDQMAEAHILNNIFGILARWYKFPPERPGM